MSLFLLIMIIISHCWNKSLTCGTWWTIAVMCPTWRSDSEVKGQEGTKCVHDKGGTRFLSQFVWTCRVVLPSLHSRLHIYTPLCASVRDSGTNITSRCENALWDNQYVWIRTRSVSLFVGVTCFGLLPTLSPIKQQQLEQLFGVC